MTDDITPVEADTLDRVIALWKMADQHSDAADLLQAQADNEQKMAEDLEDEAETLWQPMAEAHPEWWDDLRSGIDPRQADGS